MGFWNKRKRNREQADVYHEHLLQVIVSKEELKHQLQFLFRNENLVRCLAFGEAAPDYEERLLKVCLKFQFVGSLFYPAKNGQAAKLPRRSYEALFDWYLDSEEEAGYRLRQIGADERKAGELYRKYVSVKRHCLRMLSGSRETYYAGEYRAILSYIIGCKDAPRAVFRNAYSDLPTLPAAWTCDSEYGKFFH